MLSILQQSGVYSKVGFTAQEGKRSPAKRLYCGNNKGVGAIVGGKEVESEFNFLVAKGSQHRKPELTS